MIKLTQWRTGNPVALNPALIQAVYETEGKTYIDLGGTDDEVWMVSESLDVVLEKIRTAKEGAPHEVHRPA